MSTPPPELPYCIECGARLATGARICPACGTERWPPVEPARQPTRPRPRDGRAARRELSSLEVEATVASVPWIYAVGAVLNVFLLAWALAEGLSSGGHANWTSFLRQAQLSPSDRTGFVIVLCVWFFLSAAAHAAAFQGMRAKARWGWILGVILATLWSIVLTGIPVLIRLAQRDVRKEFGVS